MNYKLFESFRLSRKNNDLTSLGSWTLERTLLICIYYRKPSEFEIHFLWKTNLENLRILVRFEEISYFTKKSFRKLKTLRIFFFFLS